MIHTVKIMSIFKVLTNKVCVLVVVAAFALPAMAQFGNNDPYTAQAPGSQSFQSTSSMMGSGSNYSSNPSIGNDGVAMAPTARGVSGARRAGEDEGWEDESDPDDPGVPYPIGDAILPLLMAAGAFLLMKVLRRRRAE